MHSLTDTPLAAAPAFLDRAAVLARERVWTWRDVHAAALALAARLPPESTVCNLCDSRVGFLVTWLAALRRGCMQILPPSSGRAEMRSVLGAALRAVIVVDSDTSQAAWADEAPCVRYAAADPTASVPDLALRWLLDAHADAPLVRLYTSGSSGTPQPQTRTLGQLACGARVLAARLDEQLEDGVTGLGQIVCSVPPQHMFGLEASVMLPLITGIAVRDTKPLLPADVQAAFGEGPSTGAWIATPLHLRALALSGLALPQCRLVLASTMPLSDALAVQVEASSGGPVMEIYGSTETGVVAMRRTAMQARWLPVAGVQIECSEAGARVCGDHFPSPQVLADRVALDEHGGFELLGRESDLIKIAGRRASLASLNRVLEDLPGLTEGVFYLPAAASGTQRLVLIHAGPALDRAAAHDWLRRRIDPLFLPRTFIRVERLPRMGTGKIARAALDDLYAAHAPARQSR